LEYRDGGGVCLAFHCVGVCRLGVVKILIAIVVLVLIAASLFADYKWRRWMARRREQDGADGRQDR